MSARQPHGRSSDHAEELLDEALKESFPASDPPALVEPGGGISGTENDNRKRSRHTRLPPSKAAPIKGRGR